MNNKLYLLAVVLFVSLFSLTSCSETEQVDEYSNWQTRNQEYLDFIATQVDGEDLSDLKVGDWRKIKNYQHETASGVNDYVYIRVNEVGSGAVSPLYTDSAYVDYRGLLINDKVFDSSYSTKDTLSTVTLFKGKPDSDGNVYQHIVYIPDTEVTVPSKFVVSEVVVGWTTALQKMHVGDCWTIYIPADLGYGASGKGSIIGHSLLIFDVTLDKIAPPKKKD